MMSPAEESALRNISPFMKQTGRSLNNADHLEWCKIPTSSSQACKPGCGRRGRSLGN